MMNYMVWIEPNLYANRYLRVYYTLFIFILGEASAIFFFIPLYKSLKEKYSAYKRELEKGSITNSTSESKIKVLENKINVLEKALQDALDKQKKDN